MVLNNAGGAKQLHRMPNIMTAPKSKATKSLLGFKVISRKREKGDT